MNDVKLTNCVLGEASRVARDAGYEHALIPRQYRRAAMFWWRFGFHVIPIRPRSKRTSVKWDEWTGKLTPEAITNYWRANPDHEVGFIVGDRCVVLDADSPKAVVALYACEARQGVRPSLIVRTRRGEHHYFGVPAGQCAKTTSVLVGGAEDRIDVKSGRTMVVLAPSTNKTVARLECEHAAELAIAPLPLLQEFGAVQLADEGLNTYPASEAVDERRLALVRAGLDRLDPDSTYDAWLKVAAVVFHASGGSDEGFTLFFQWSRGGRKFKGLSDCRAKWSSFRLDHPRPARIGTLRHILQEQGHDWGDICADAEGFELHLEPEDLS